MGTKWRDDTMTKSPTTRGEKIAITLLILVTMAWLFFAAMEGQENKEDRLKDESGTIPPLVCTNPGGECG